MNLKFEIQESKLLKGVWVVAPEVSSDIRGTIWTSFIKAQIEEFLPEGLHFKHDKFSESTFNVLRGIHGDEKSWKLVTCVYGEILQVVVDLRENSPTYMKWQKFVINKNYQKMILIPPCMGNAFYVKSNNAVYHYKLAYKGSYIDADRQFSYRWNSKHFGIDWPTDNPLLSSRDQKAAEFINRTIKRNRNESK